MFTKTAAISLLALGCCLAGPAMAQDDVMTQAKQQFQAIPDSPSRIAGQPAVCRQGRTRQDALFRPATFGEPYDQLQLLS